jgi:hypothetical protein
MTQQNVQDIATGPIPENQGKPLLLESRTKRTKPKKTKGESTSQNPLPTGSTSETQKNHGESENGSGTEPIQNPQNSLPQPRPMPVPSPIVDRKVEALRRLRVKSEELEKVPQISPTLSQAEGGLPRVLDAMRFASQDEVISAFLKKYDSIPSGDREVLPWEAIAISAGVNMSHLLGSAMLALTQHAANISRIIAVTNHPSITKKRVEYGLLPSGEKDRYALDVMVGAMPSAKGPTFIGKAVFGAPGGSSKDKDDDDEPSDATAVFGMDDDLDKLFPSPSAMQDKLVPIRQRLLDK